MFTLIIPKKITFGTRNIYNTPSIHNPIPLQIFISQRRDRIENRIMISPSIEFIQLILHFDTITIRLFANIENSLGPLSNPTDYE